MWIDISSRVKKFDMNIVWTTDGDSPQQKLPQNGGQQVKEIII